MPTPYISLQYTDRQTHGGVRLEIRVAFLQLVTGVQSVLTDPAGKKVDLNVTFKVVDDTCVWIVTPMHPLRTATTYRFEVTSGSDEEGNVMDPYIDTFNTSE